MIKVKDGYAKLVGTTASGSASHILLSNGGVKAVSDFALADGTNATGTWSIDISGNAKTATTATTASKLSTVSKTAWGLTYWTSGGVPTSISGDMTGVGNITIASNGNVDRFITFDTTSTRNWRIGYLGTGSGDANYLAFQSTKTLTAADGWHDMLKIGCETGNATFTGQLVATKFIGPLNNTLTFSAGAFSAKTYNNSEAVTVNVPTHTSHLTNNSGFLTEHQSLDNYVTLNTNQTITGLKTFQSNSSTTGVSLILKNNGWTGNMSTAMDFYNGRSYTVPNARIETKMAGDGKAGGTLIFYTLTKHGSTNPNPNGLTERLRIDDNGTTKVLGTLLVSGTSVYPLSIDTSGSENGLLVKMEGSAKTWIGYTPGTGAYLYTYAGPHKLGISDSGVGFIDSNTILHSGNSSVADGGSTWGSSITVKINGVSKTLTIPANPNVDTKVTLTITTTSNTSWRPILIGYSYSDADPFAPSTVTNTVYATHLMKIKPSTGALWANSTIAASGFVKASSSDSYVLLGGGGHKSISSFQTTYDGRYVLKAGDTMTGPLTISTSNWGNLLVLNRVNNGENWGPSIIFKFDGTHNGALSMQSNLLYIGDNGNVRYKAWHEGNDGSGSGLDADLLDGKHASAFALASHTHTYIESKAYYTFTSSTLPNSFDWGVSAGFVADNAGYGSYGSVLTVRTYTGGGGTLQLYAPYSKTYGGERLKARFGNYDSNVGNSWTTLKEIAWTSDIPNPTNYYWANVKVSSSSSTTTYPTFGSLYVYNDSCNNSNDALAYFRHRSTNDWCIIVDKGGYDWGVDVRSFGPNAMKVAGRLTLGQKVSERKYTWLKLTTPGHTGSDGWCIGIDDTSDNSCLYMKYNENDSTYFYVRHDGCSFANHFYENSDIRYKTIINNLAIKANQLANLPLFDFKWLDNEDLLNTGTSAQAVQELLPYIVSGNDRLTLDYGVLGTIAGITACKELTEQEKEINELKEQIKFLKDEINNLKTNKLWQS